MPRVMLQLDDVVCYDPEDLSGDEFYVIGAVSDGEQTEGITTVPISVDKNETKAFGVGGGLVFDKEIPPDRVVKIALTAFDEDGNQDWQAQSKVIDEITSVVATGLAAVPNPYTTGASVLLPYVVKGASALFALDKDDNLGSYAQDFPVWSLASGQSYTQQWQFAGQWGGGFLGFSKWSYALRYTISVQG